MISEYRDIGENCKIGENVNFVGNVDIGDNCKIFNGAVIGEIPQDVKFSGERTELIINNFFLLLFIQWLILIVICIYHCQI